MATTPSWSIICPADTVEYQLDLHCYSVADKPRFVADDGGISSRTRERGPLLFGRRLAISYVLIVVFEIAVGRMLTGPLRSSGLAHWDDRVVASVANGRSVSMNSFTKFFSKLADAPTIVAVGAVVAIALLLQRRVRTAALVPILLAFELITFLSISYPVNRTRPDVVHLGSVPSTGSFPSGHIAATIVLYGAVALIIRYARLPGVLVAVAAGWTVIAALAVGWSRVYRGMHHPLDVVAGAVLGIAVLVAARPALEATVSSETRNTGRGVQR